MQRLITNSLRLDLQASKMKLLGLSWEITKMLETKYLLAFSSNSLLIKHEVAAST